MIYLLLLLLLVLTGCTYTPMLVPLDEPEAFHPCFPLRGEEQETVIQTRGHSFNSTETGCV